MGEQGEDRAPQQPLAQRPPPAAAPPGARVSSISLSYCTPDGQAVTHAMQPRQLSRWPTIGADSGDAVALVHQHDPAAGRVRLLAPERVGRAGGQAEPAVHAVVDQRRLGRALGVPGRDGDRAAHAANRSRTRRISSSAPGSIGPWRSPSKPSGASTTTQGDGATRGAQRLDVVGLHPVAGRAPRGPPPARRSAARPRAGSAGPTPGPSRRRPRDAAPRAGAPTRRRRPRSPRSLAERHGLLPRRPGRAACPRPRASARRATSSSSGRWLASSAAAWSAAGSRGAQHRGAGGAAERVKAHGQLQDPPEPCPPSR